MVLVRSLQLTNFRCYESVRLDDLPSGAIVFYGPNGAGKTNILEAVSLLSPGRGLRGVKAEDMQKRGAAPSDGPWAVSAALHTAAYGETRIGTGLDPQSARRIVRINGAPAKGQNALAEYLSCVWLTPQMDRIFLDGASVRRKFLDRLVFAFDPGHAGRITRYENAMSQRAKLLKEQAQRPPDPAWLDALETDMAATGTAIAAARLALVQKLQSSCDRAAQEGVAEDMFPRARLFVTGSIEELLRRAPALEVEDMFRYQLCNTRLQDSQTGGAATGPHKSDLAVTYAAKDMDAAQCSTGEQKALLIGLVLAHARMIAAERGAPPVLLFDEVAAHLDENRRAGLYRLLSDMNAQVFLTGTDAVLFDAVKGTARVYEVRDAALVSAASRAAA